VNEYRVTKYNPALRDETGAYKVDEWTFYAQIDRSFGGVTLTEQEYKRVESAYIQATLAFLTEAGVAALSVEGLENSRRQQLAWHEGTVVGLDKIPEVMGGILREEFWCRLQGEQAFLHFGWDYYMYIGVPHRCPAAEQKATELGLYVEEWESPYHRESP